MVLSENFNILKKNKYISNRSREVNLFCDLDAKELIQELRSISNMLQSLDSSLRKLWTVNRQL